MSNFCQNGVFLTQNVEFRLRVFKCDFSEYYKNILISNVLTQNTSLVGFPRKTDKFFCMLSGILTIRSHMLNFECDIIFIFVLVLLL